MSINQGSNQLRQDLQNELSISNQLLFLISKELKEIKEFTKQGGDFEANIKENSKLMERLGGNVLANIDMENVCVPRAEMDVNTSDNSNLNLTN